MSASLSPGLVERLRNGAEGQLFVGRPGSADLMNEAALALEAKDAEIADWTACAIKWKAEAKKADARIVALEGALREVMDTVAMAWPNLENAQLIKEARALLIGGGGNSVSGAESARTGSLPVLTETQHSAGDDDLNAKFKRLAEVLNGCSIEDCQDLTVSLLGSVIVSHYRQAGMPLEYALECADAAIADVKENVRRNWSGA